MCWWEPGVCPGQDVAAELAETIAAAHNAGQMAAWQKAVKAVATIPPDPALACMNVQNALIAAQTPDWVATEAELDMVIDPGGGNWWDAACPGAIDELAEIVALAHGNNEATWREAIDTMCATPTDPAASCGHVSAALQHANDGDWVAAINDLDNGGGGDRRPDDYLNPEEAEVWCGTYQLGSATITITIEDGKLIAFCIGRKRRLYCDGEGRCCYRIPRACFTFQSGEGCVIEQCGPKGTMVENFAEKIPDNVQS